MSGGIEVMDDGLAGQIAALEQQKKDAMANDEFERCASIRDEINALRRQMATGAGASNAGTSATRGSVPDSDDIDTEWDMDKARGLRPTPSGGGSAFDPDKAPPPESLDPDYGRRAEQLGGAGEARVRRRAAGLSEQQAARAEATGKKGGSAPHRCDWDTVFIVALACVLFSFLILDVYAQIKMHNDKQEVHEDHDEL